MPLLALLTLSAQAGATHAQASKPGSYVGTITMTGSQVSPKVTYRAAAKVTMPISERKEGAVTAEFLAGEAPEAVASITQWDISHTEKSPDSDGKYSSWSCKLAAPVDVPVSATGVLNVNLKKKTHALSLTLLSTRDVAFNCVHSRSGPYKTKRGITLYAGTGVPGEHYSTQLPFADPAALVARFTLQPTADTKQQYGPIVQEWDLKQVR